MTCWTLYPGQGRLSDAASPDVRGRSYVITVRCSPGEGVLISHGDRNAGYALRIADGHLIHDYVHAGVRSTVVGPVSPDASCLELRVRRTGEAGLVTLLADGVEIGSGAVPTLARARVGYTGVDLGCDRGITVGDYPSPSRFSGVLRSVEVVAEDDQWLDEEALWEIEGSTG